MSDNTGRWLIVKDGQPVIVFTSMLDMSVTSDSALPEEPIEKGSFAMYNRTLYSDRLEVKLAIEGDNADLQRAQDTLKALKSGTDIFSLVTPDYEHKNLTLEGYDYTRDTTASNGLLVVTLRLKEIREVETATTVVSVPAQSAAGAKGAKDTKTAAATDAKPLTQSNCKNASNVSKTQTGKTQPAEPTAKEKESIAYKVFGG